MNAVLLPAGPIAQGKRGKLQAGDPAFCPRLQRRTSAVDKRNVHYRVEERALPPPA